MALRTRFARKDPWEWSRFYLYLKGFSSKDRTWGASCKDVTKNKHMHSTRVKLNIRAERRFKEFLREVA